MFTTKHKIAIVSVINDLATDQRVLRTAEVLKSCGYQVVLFGRELPDSPGIDHLPYTSKRIKMIFRNGVFFYFFYQIRLFIFLLFSKSDLLFSNDLDTLLPNYLVSRIKKIQLIYDSHELFCEVPELMNAPLKKKIWQSLEKLILPHLNHCITVNQSIADWFKKQYHTDFTVVRNIPDSTESPALKTKEELAIPSGKTILILQGAGINIQRGAEELVEAMQFVNEAHLLIIGSGDVFDTLKRKVQELHLENKITIKDRMRKSELIHYTKNADIGVSIDKDTNLNYHFSLPNKIFDYLQANLAILASRLPEIENLVNQYDTGCFIENHQPEHIAQVIQLMIHSGKLVQWKKNTLKANEENNWNKEKEKLISIIQSLN